MKNRIYRLTFKLSFKALVSTLLAILLMSAAVYPQTPDVRGRSIGRRDTPQSFVDLWRKGEGDTSQKERPSIRDLLLTKDPPQRQLDLRGTHKTLKEVWRQQIDRPDRGNLRTIPTWSDTYTYQGLTYKYTMVGSDPERGSATTTIPTVIVPVRFVFEDGTVIDPIADVIEGRTVIQGVVNSPIFQPYPFTVGGVSVGNTQYGDAFQRAEFWDLVSKRSHDYHVLLAQPTIAPVHEVFLSGPTWRDSSGRPFAIDETFLENIAIEAVRQANVSPETLPIVVWGNVYGPAISAAPRLGVDGFHGAYEVPGGVQTYIAAGYHPSTGQFGPISPYSIGFSDNIYYGTENTNSLSRQLASWLNDPFQGNYTPGWNTPLSNFQICESEPDSDLMDVVKVSSEYVVITGTLPTVITTD